MTYEVNLIVQAAVMIGAGLALYPGSAAAGVSGTLARWPSDPQTLKVEKVRVRPAEIDAHVDEDHHGCR